MKAEERHELQQNDLESWLYYRLPHFLKEYGSYILLGFALVLLAYQLWNWYENKQLAKLEASAIALDEAARAETKNPVGKLREIINNPDAPATIKAQAWLALGRFYNTTVLLGNPSEGIQEVKVTRSEALEGAQRAYESVLREHADQPLFSAEAKVGLAVVAENRGEWDVAKKLYEELADPKGRWAGTAVASEAQRRLSRLPQLEAPVTFGPKLDSAKSILDSLGREMGPALPPTTASVPASAPATAPVSPATAPAQPTTRE